MEIRGFSREVSMTRVVVAEGREAGTEYYTPYRTPNIESPESPHFTISSCNLIGIFVDQC